MGSRRCRSPLGVDVHSAAMHEEARCDHSKPITEAIKSSLKMVNPKCSHSFRASTNEAAIRDEEGLDKEVPVGKPLTGALNDQKTQAFPAFQC